MLTFDVPRTHEMYRDFVRSIEGDIQTADFCKNGVRLELHDGRTLDLLIAGDGKISLAIMNRLKERETWPVDFDPEDIESFWFAVH